MNYYKYVLSEAVGEAKWGGGTFLYEVGEDRWAVRQLEIFEDGIVLSYDASHDDDQFGFLADQRFPDDREGEYYRQYEISKAEFEQAWRTFNPVNR
jgi:hypothetical protein